MNELDSKIKCKYCAETFVLFEDLYWHKCNGMIDMVKLTKELEDIEKKLNCWEKVVAEEPKEGLTEEEAREIIDLVEEEE